VANTERSSAQSGADSDSSAAGLVGAHLESPAAEQDVSRLWVTITVAVLALFGATLVWYATTRGVGIENDSVLYARMAAEIRSTQALFTIHYPPGLPSIWALAANPYTAARVLNMVAMAALVVITGAAVWWSTRRTFPTLFATSVVAVAQPLLAAHFEALSEPLALALGAGGLWLTLVALDDDRTWIWCLGAFSLGFAVIVRYAAVIYPAAAVLLALSERRWRRATLMAAVSALPLTLWSVRNLFVTHLPTDRSIAYHPIRWPLVEMGRNAVAAWFDPIGVVFGKFPATGWLAVVAAAALFGWGIWRGSRLAKLASFFAVGYIIFLLLVIEFVDAGTTLESRFILPAFISAVWVAAALLSWLLGDRSDGVGWSPPRWLVRSAVGLAWLLMLAHAYHGIRYASQIHREGIGATSAKWRTSPLVLAVDLLSPGTVVWTNAPLQLSLLTRAQILELPFPVVYTTRRPWSGYAAALARIPSGVYVADFKRVAVQMRGAVEDLARTKGLDTLTRTPDGVLYRVR